MGRSFFTGTEDQLYTGSNSFSAQISATPTAFGLTADQAAAYAALNATWEAAYLAAKAPETRTKGAVAAKNSAKLALRQMASDLAKIIDGTATVTDQQKADLGLSVRGTPGPVGPPGTPGEFRVTLSADGTLDLGWRCKNPRGCVGVMYQLYRRIGTGEFTYIGGTGTRRFTDTTVPAGVTGVTYQIRAVRSTSMGPSAQFNVNFGVTPSGTLSASVEQSPKLAA